VESSSSSSTRLKSDIALFSKRFHDPSLSVMQELNSGCLQYPTEVGRVKLHEQRHCYEAKCDACREMAPVYILQMSVEIGE
jgi:hypothetical protein